MKLHEYQSKEIFKKYGIPVPNGQPAKSPEEAQTIFDKLNLGSAVVKAQILAGGRGKGGGILMADSAAKAREAAAHILSTPIATAQTGGTLQVSRTVLVEQKRKFEKELYLGLTIDRSRGLPVLIFSEAGGMDIEEVNRKSPDKILKHAFDPFGPLEPSAFRDAFKLSKELEPFRVKLASVASGLARLFRECDAQLVEINPLVTAGQDLLALDAKIVLDDNALYRHKDLEALKDPDEDTANERRAKKAGLSYVSLEGNIGCLVNGAGLAMATMDVIKDVGGEPANFLDVGGGADKARVLEAFRIILEDPSVKAVFVNIFGGIMRCDIIAQALVEAANEIDIRVPVVVRLEGTKVAEGREILKRARITLHQASSMDEGARRAVELASVAA